VVPKIVGDVGILALDEQDKLVKIEFFDPQVGVKPLI